MHQSGVLIFGEKCFLVSNLLNKSIRFHQFHFRTRIPEIQGSNVLFFRNAMSAKIKGKIETKMGTFAPVRYSVQDSIRTLHMLLLFIALTDYFILVLVYVSCFVLVYVIPFIFILTLCLLQILPCIFTNLYSERTVIIPNRNINVSFSCV